MRDRGPERGVSFKRNLILHTVHCWRWNLFSLVGRFVFSVIYWKKFFFFFDVVWIFCKFMRKPTHSFVFMCALLFYKWVASHFCWTPPTLSFLFSFWFLPLLGLEKEKKMEDLGSMWDYEEVGSFYSFDKFFLSLFPLLGLVWSGI